MIGIGCAVVFFIAWIGAGVSFLGFGLHRQFREHAGDDFWIWREPHARNQFLIFLGFCVLGLASALVGFLYGGFPTS